LSKRLKAEPKRVVTKRQLSRWERERRRRRILQIVILVVIVSVLGMLGYGYYDTRVKPWHQPIVRINDTVFDMNYFVKMLRASGLSSTSDTSSAQSVATAIQDNELMKQGLEKDFGVVISDEAIEEKLQEILSSYSMTAEELKTNLADVGISVEDFKQMYIEPSLVQSELQQRIGDQDYPADQEFEHVRVQAMLVAGADNATAVRDRWLAGEDFNTLVADYSPSKYYPNTSSDNTTVEWIPRGIESAAFDEYAFAEGSENSTVSDAIPESEGSENYWLINVLNKEDRALSEAHRDTWVSKAFNDWLNEEKKKGEEEGRIKSYLDDEKIGWALAHI